MSIKKQQVDLDPRTVSAAKAVLEALRALRSKHDGRLLALMLLDQAASVYGHLKVLGYETEASIDEMFTLAATRAKAATAQPIVEMQGQLPSSEVPS